MFNLKLVTGFFAKKEISMKYKFCPDLRVRECDELIFLVNISDNSIFAIKKSAYQYLCLQLHSDMKTDKMSNDFIRFLEHLIENNIIEVV